MDIWMQIQLPPGASGDRHFRLDSPRVITFAGLQADKIYDGRGPFEEQSNCTTKLLHYAGEIRGYMDNLFYFLFFYVVS